MVPIPAEADEDARRCTRERAELVSERVSLVNHIGAILDRMFVARRWLVLRYVTSEGCAGVASTEPPT